MKHPLKGLVLLCLCLPVLAQTAFEPCSRFERDGVPGFSRDDLHANLAYWPHVTNSRPGAEAADYDDDARVSVLDFTRQMGCVQLGPGLLGKYYGYQTGQNQADISLTNTDHPTFAAAEVQVTPELDHQGNFGPLLNSSMQQWFRADFHGFLEVPATANYRFVLTGGEGQRLQLGGATLIQYEGAPRSGESQVRLAAGLYPIHVAYITKDQRSPSITLAWAADGGVIGPALTTIGPAYLRHNRSMVPAHAPSDLAVTFSQANHSRVTQANLALTAYLFGAETDFDFELNGQAHHAVDGVVQLTVALQPGLNHIPWRLRTGDGRSRAGTLVLHYDAGLAGSSGLAAMFYNTGYADAGTVNRHMRPLISTIYDTAHIGSIRDGRNLKHNGRLLGHDLTTWLRGRLWIASPAEYRFHLRSNLAAQMRVNGRVLITQFNRDRITAAVFLERGFHHIEISNREINHSPHHELTWSGPGFDRQEIPANLLSHLASDRIAEPEFDGNQGHAARVGGDLIAEYLFDRDAPFADSGEHHFDLWRDARAAPRDEGGLTSTGPLELGSTAAGSHFVETVRDSNAFSFEFDFFYQRAPVNRRDLLRIGWRPFPYEPFVYLFLVENRLRFTCFGATAGEYNLVPGQRYHVVYTWDGARLRLYINGVDQIALGADVAAPNPETLDNTQTLWFRDLYGTVNVFALYSRALSPAEIIANRQANLALRPGADESPAGLPVGADFQIVPPGTSEAALNEALHVLNRVSFGPSPESLHDILTLGVDAWLERQLNPETIAQNEWVDEDLAFHHADDNAAQLRAWMLLRMVHSERQLEEVMTWFWENHFSTDLTKTAAPHEERLENDRFRALAFGRFEDLLLASARNLPMTRYLDSATNVVGAPNENYAREILELHSYGEDNGYVYADIVAAARCFTGWSERDGRFTFNPGRHDFGAKSLLGLELPAHGGFDQGLALIRHIAASPRTAEFIATKLCRLFVADEPPPDIVAACKASYLNHDGEIRAVLRTLFQHPRFRSDPHYRRNKVKTPLEFWVSTQRALGARDHQATIQGALNLLGMDLFHFMEPTGFAERNAAWVDTNAVFYRWQVINGLSANHTDYRFPSLNYPYLRHRYGLTSAYRALRFMELMFAGGRSDATVRQITESWLTDGAMADIALTEEHHVRYRLPQTLNLYMRLPGFNLQ